MALAQANAHMLAAEAARLALILKHFSPKITDVTMAEKAARRIFTNTRSARDGMIATLDYAA